MARPRPHPIFGAPPQGCLCGFRCRAPLRRTLYSKRRQQGMRLPGDPTRRQKAYRLPAIWPRLHAGNAARVLHGLFGGRLRRLFQLRPDAGAGAMNVVSRAPRLASRRLDLAEGRVDLTHGAGGRAMQQLIEEIFRPAFDNPILARGDDQATFEVAGGRMVMSTDSFVVSPLFFPGGDIGSLAVHGTVNDVAMSGARPLYLSAGFVIEA